MAFRAALADLEGQGADLIVSLGDVAQGGPQPLECVELLRELDCACVFGNSDAFLLTLDPGAEDLDEQQMGRLLAVGRWSQERLGEDGVGFLRSFEPIIEVDLGGAHLVCCHGSPRSNEEVVVPQTPREQIRTLIGEADAVAGGHVHRQWLDRLGRQVWVGVGSVGLAYDFKEPMDDQPFLPFAEYAIVGVSRGEIRVEFRRVPYDVDQVLDGIRASGMPHADHFASQWKTS